MKKGEKYKLKAFEKLGQIFLMEGFEEMFCSEEIFVRTGINDYPVCFNVKVGEIIDSDDVYLDRICNDGEWITAYRLQQKPITPEPETNPNQFSKDYPTEYMALCQLKAANEELRKELDKAKGVDRWIPCSERLPEIGDRVLVIDDDGDQFIDIRMGDILAEPTDERWSVYTHWQPLPSSPAK